MIRKNLEHGLSKFDNLPLVKQNPKQRGDVCTLFCTQLISSMGFQIKNPWNNLIQAWS